ncbi:MAG: NAD(P)H-dependent glycerol-3-phosphate dehydrogenase [Candidatus Gygaella obscura]|nr:NAD(P)H-dependent glycerol-3-phosphate dehydrogenase [Candidatus Gygaella obscura]
MMTIKKITILGDGGWGTALAILLFKNGYPVNLWSFSCDYARFLDKKRVNKKFLPGVKIPKGINITSSLDCVEQSELIVIAVPSLYIRSVLKKLKKKQIKNKIFVSAVKGIEIKSLKRMSQVIEDELGKVNLAVLSGPTIAYEVARNVPTTVVVASRSLTLAKKLQHIFAAKRFRVYTHRDVVGVELGGSLKNVIAIACGISDGLGFGTNTKSAILVRGLVEIVRLGRSLGAKERTFSGISGFGDLATTCISTHSRNRFVGESLGKGESIKNIISNMDMVAEGVYTVTSACALAKKNKIEMPIAKQVYNVIYRKKSPSRAVDELMMRKKKSEFS